DIIDISARTNISRVATLRGTNVTAVAAEDSIALVAVQTTTSQGAKYFLRILDLSNPAEPTFISEVPITAVVNYILIDGTRAYLSQNSSGFSIIDFSDPLSPQRLSTTDTPGNARKIAVRDGQLFLADNSAGLRIYDITNALAPKLLSTLATPRYANGVAVQNSTAYIANGFSRQLIEVDISDVMFPTAVATNVHIGSPAAVILRGEHIFVAEGSGGVSVYNNGDLPASIQVTVVANGPALEIHAHETGGRPFTEADLPRLALERSKDLKSWEELPSGASLSDGSAKFLVERTEQDSFYRLVTE
ncbi:MAG: LVIVD repeat-containing protein, partial [Limisphaerales bacterium]